jgi:hypothetical protein
LFLSSNNVFFCIRSAVSCQICLLFYLRCDYDKGGDDAVSASPPGSPPGSLAGFPPHWGVEGAEPPASPAGSPPDST